MRAKTRNERQIDMYEISGTEVEVVIFRALVVLCFSSAPAHLKTP